MAIKTIDGGISAVPGFTYAGIHCGIKKKKKDLGLILAETAVNAAGVFTLSKVKAAPVLVSQEHLKDGKAQAIIVNSGNANACNGAQGIKNARRMAEAVAAHCKIAPQDVLVASTGIIGVPLPIEVIENGVKRLVKKLAPTGGHEVAEAMLTTDTFTKEIAVQCVLADQTVTIGGVAKGSGMIHPNMGTMLSFITTDAAITTPMLRLALQRAVDKTFNMITVDGDTSTNDTVFILANGKAGNPEITTPGAQLDQFIAALQVVCTYLAKQIAKDGEGATKLVEVRVKGAAAYPDAHNAAFAVATSNLVKTAMFGEDPNWGRIMAALGYSDANLEAELIDVYLGDVQIAAAGQGVAFDPEQVKAVLQQPEIVLTIDLNMGNAAATVWTCDLSYGYVRINGHYHT